MGTAERRIEIMKLLCRERYITMPVLAQRFSVSVRTIQRDIDELGFMMPLQIKTGRYEGGVYVMDDYRWDKAYMSAEDITLLTMIKAVGEKREKLMLNENSMDRLNRIISTYSPPQTK